MATARSAGPAFSGGRLSLVLSGTAMATRATSAALGFSGFGAAGTATVPVSAAGVHGVEQAQNGPTQT